MKFAFITLSALFTLEAFAGQCRDIPTGSLAPRKKAQTVRALTGKDTGKKLQETFLGEDVVYEGAPCPEGRVCIETLFNNRVTPVTFHGQVVVINKETGNVESLAPIRFKDPNGARGQSISERGIPPFDQARWRGVCQGIRNFNRDIFRDDTPAQGRTLEVIAQCSGGVTSLTTDPNPLLDIYSYHNTSINLPNTPYSPFTEIYRSFSPSAKARTIEFLNSGNITKNGEFSQAGSVQYGGQVTVSRIAKVVGDVRKALGCEPAATNQRVNLSSRLLDQAPELRACGIELVNGPSLKRLKLSGENFVNLAEDVPRKARRLRRGQFEVNTTVNTENEFDIPFQCSSVQESPAVEIITCQNGELAPVLPNSSEYDREIQVNNRTAFGGRSNPQIKVVGRVVNGRVESVAAQKNFTYYADIKTQCTLVPVQGVPGATGNNGSSVIGQ